MPQTQTDATRVQFWAGTRAEFTAIEVKQSNWLYFITDDEVLYRGGQPFAQDIEKLICFASNAPTTASLGQRYYNTTTKRLYSCTASSGEGVSASWGSPEDPVSGHVYFNMDGTTLFTWSGTTMVNLSSTGSITVQTTAQRTAYVPDIGAIIYDSTDGNVYVGDGITPGGKIVNSGLYTTVAQLAADVQIIIEGGEPVQGTLTCGVWTDYYDNVVQFGAWTAS